MIASLANSFRLKVAGASLLTSCAALLLATTVFYTRQWSDEREQLVADRTIAAEVMAGNLAATLLFNDAAHARDTLASAKAIPDFRQVVVYDASGRFFAGTTATHGQVAPVRPSGADVASAAYEEDRLVIKVPVKLDADVVGELVLVLGLEHLNALGRTYVVFAAILLLGVALGAGLLSYLVAGRVIRPVNTLSRAIRRVRSNQDFSVTVPVTGGDELGRLTEDFNGLLETLEERGAELTEAMDALVEARDQAEAASATKSQFLANMSHEIRTPLNGVLGMAQVMAREPLSKAQRERLDVIRASGQGLLSLLNDLLDLSKIEAARLELEDVEFDIEDVIGAACGPFTAVAESKDLALTQAVSSCAAGTWRGDPTRVRQIIGNLVSNAVKFTREGHVAVKVERVDGSLRVEVEDTGIGIAPDKLSLLFDKFAQADASTTREFGGTGLGLAISRELARWMGGDISVFSQDGRGTTFTVSLPLHRVGPRVARATADPEAAVPQSAAEERPLRILAAEDNATNQLVLRAMLEPVGAEVEIVENGALAIEAWKNGAFDLILMDVQMPVMDGVAATRAIRAAEAAGGGPRTPIVALTANSMKHQVGEYFAAGMDDLVPKPIETEVLYTVLDRVLAAAAETENVVPEDLHRANG